MPEPAFDILVVGAGHAGCEAASAAARLGARTALLTISAQRIAQMSCNPAIGGLAKGQIVREIDALGGLMAQVADSTAIQYRLLNRSKGPAVRSPRAQCDRPAYVRTMRDCLARHSDLALCEETVTDLLIEDGRVLGLQAETPEGPLEVRADLVVGADGRHSDVRMRAGLKVEDFGAPMDVIWFRLSKHASDGQQLLGRIQAVVVFVTLDRGDYWQCAYVIPKGGFEQLRSRGLAAFRAAIAGLNPEFADRLQEIASWDDLKLLTITVDRLKRWSRPGLLCIGDAAHAMSPVGGVGINLAIQDAVAATNLLWQPLSQGRVPAAQLASVQARREWPTKMMQAVQLFIQKRVISNVLGLTERPKPPFAVTLFNRFPLLRRFPARLIGLGFRPEHVRSPERRA
jgi:2-polyprenyl-6-methoxyphenol hydroxylase-like FAD-dependent oxidoreductase